MAEPPHAITAEAVRGAVVCRRRRGTLLSVISAAVAAWLSALENVGEVQFRHVLHTQAVTSPARCPQPKTASSTACGTVIFAPQIVGAIPGGHADIVGHFTHQQARLLAAEISGKPLPQQLTPAS